jgi:2-hydroxy-6-oxonona-2,4-dienedioate hydrolase
MSISFATGCEQLTTADGTRLSFYDVGSGRVPVVLLHGLFGSPSNWQSIMHDLGHLYRFLALQLPIEFGTERRHTSFESLGQLTDHVVRFYDEMGLDSAVLCGNSLGGQIALDFYLRHPERVERLVLCGSAGLFERNLSGGQHPRLCRRFVRAQACEIFYDPMHVSEELVDDVYAMLCDRGYRRFLLKVAKATRDRYMLEELANVKVPTLIVWGRDDAITPPFVAEQFCDHISSAELVYIDRCGHAPPIERPDEFARVLHDFLSDMTSDPVCVAKKPR